MPEKGGLRAHSGQNSGVSHDFHPSRHQRVWAGDPHPLGALVARAELIMPGRTTLVLGRDTT
ncbi:MAG TPA: hypothetical protein DEB38_07105 [Acidimicrobiaceae bacterium]|nr:hypothetical protein [Acidimicrobiaceae bacterium]